MKVINKLESYPTGDMIVPYCPNCDNPTYSERKCPFCNTELEYEEIIEKDKEIERLNNGIKELDDMFYETFRISQNGYYSISEWELKDFTNKLQELKGIDKNEQF